MFQLLHVTARGYISALKTALEEDSRKHLRSDMWDFLKHNLKAVINDGAATMSGNENGFGVLLSQELTGDKGRLFRVHCGAHRLQLALRHVVDKIQALYSSRVTLKLYLHSKTSNIVRT